MPIYDYKCKQCGKEDEHMVKNSEAPNPVCKECGSETERLLSAMKGCFFSGEGAYLENTYKVFGKKGR